MSEGKVWTAYEPLASAKTLRAFLRDRTLVRGLMGPVSGGKTSCCFGDLFNISYDQEPDMYGFRRTRHLVVRDTYNHMENTTLKTFAQWYPIKGPGVVMTGGKNRQTDYSWTFGHEDGETTVVCEFIFAAIGDNSAEDFLKGFEVTTVWLSEGDLMHPSVLEYAESRIGRFPSRKDGVAPTFKGVIIDFNAPTFDNYLYDLFFHGDPKYNKLFSQPSGLSPEREGHEIQDLDLYERLEKTRTARWVKRNVKNEWGTPEGGQPVYPEFSRAIHVLKGGYEPSKWGKIYIGMDAGRTPSAVFMQMDGEGQIVVFDEVYRENMGAATFANNLKDYISQRYGWEFDYEGAADPASQNKTEASDHAWLEIMNNILPFNTYPAVEQNPFLRVESVKMRFTRMITGIKPSIVISENCKILIAGFEHGYKFKKIQGNTEEFATNPEKNIYSHLQDGLQYGVLTLASPEELSGLNPKYKQHNSAPKQARKHLFSEGARW